MARYQLAGLTVPILLTQAQQKYVLYLIAMLGAKCISLKVLIHPQST